MKASVKQTATKWTEDNIIVRPIDTKSIAKQINNECHLEPEHGGKRYYVTIGEIGVILEPKRAYLDAECCGDDIENDATINLLIYEREDIDEHNHFMGVFPTLEEHFTLSEIEPFLRDPVSLKVFMGKRYNYNGRIENNLHNWLRHFNS